jgi:hypothetical protein
VDRIKSTTAKRREREKLEPRAKRPRFTRGLLWEDEDDILSATAQYSLTAMPVPHVPIEELSSPAVKQTIADYPHLFRVDCHINVIRFKKLLKEHPN